MIKYYAKQALLPVIYLIFMAITAFGILAIGDDLLWLKIILGVLNIALYCVIVFIASYNEGKNAVKVRSANDLERRIIIKTGEERPLKLNEEYKPYKGFIVGLFAVIPLLFFLALHTLLHFTAGYDGLGAIISLVYLLFFEFFIMKTGVSDADAAVTTLPWYVFYGTLIAVPVIILVSGIGYIMGAKVIIRQQEMIKAKQREIYGDRS